MSNGQRRAAAQSSVDERDAHQIARTGQARTDDMPHPSRGVDDRAVPCRARTTSCSAYPAETNTSTSTPTIPRQVSPDRRCKHADPRCRSCCPPAPPGRRWPRAPRRSALPAPKSTVTRIIRTVPLGDAASLAVTGSLCKEALLRHPHTPVTPRSGQPVQEGHHRVTSRSTSVSVLICGIWYIIKYAHALDLASSGSRETRGTVSPAGSERRAVNRDASGEVAVARDHRERDFPSHQLPGSSSASGPHG